MTRTWCELGPPVSISQPLSLEKVEDLCEAWVTWQLLPPWLGLSLVASGLVSCVSCWCEPTRGSSLLRSPPGLLSLFPPQWAESCLCSACFHTGSWGSCWKRVAWSFCWSQYNVSHAISGQYQCTSSPVQRHVRLSFKRPRAINLTLPVKTVPAGKKEECTLIFWTFLRARILPVYGNVRSLTVFPQYGASSSCIGSPGFYNDRCFFFIFLSDLKSKEGIWLYDERTPDRKRNFWSSLLLKRRSWGGKSTDVEASYDLKQKLGWCQNCWRMKLSFPMMVKKSPVARNLSLVWVSCHIQGGSFFTSPQSPPSFLPSLDFPLFSCFAFFTSGSFHCQSAARL